MNIEPKPLPSIIWSADDPRAQVNDLYEKVQAKVQLAIDWYMAKKTAPKRVSRLLRFVAIAGVVLGGLCPILAGAIDAKFLWPDFSFTSLGYVLLAISAAALLTDTYGGFSNSWMRYIDAHLKLDAMLHRFQLDFAIACAQYDLDPQAKKDPARLTALIEKLRAFAAEASELVQTETQAWMVEFRNQLALLQKASEREKPAASKPAADDAVGEVNVTVSNYDSASTPVFLFVDQAPTAQLSAKTGKLKARPGARVVAAQTLVGGQLVRADTTANVVAGGTTEVSLTLPLT